MDTGFHALEHLNEAIKFQNFASELANLGYDDSYDDVSFYKHKALKELGTGLHALQDIYAHRDEYVFYGRPAGFPKPRGLNFEIVNIAVPVKLASYLPAWKK
ncbi:MAG: hypothetical protein GY749_39320 [Desulfobacteraceae bacterium]|nr:hypothetical protein [Desulfobacteraceae bacterium]